MAAIRGTRFLSVSRQVGAHLSHGGPAGGLSKIQIYNLSTLAFLEVQALPLSYLLLPSGEGDLDNRTLTTHEMLPCRDTYSALSKHSV